MEILSTAFTQCIFSTDFNFYKYSSGEEKANVNLFTTTLHTYFRIPQKTIYFV